MAHQPERVLSNPLDVFQALFDGSSIEDKHANVDLGEKAMVEAILQNRDLRSRVPHLTKKSILQAQLAPNSLTRYRGLVQDIYNTEYYVGVGVEINRKNGQKRLITTKYRDTVDNPAQANVELDFESEDSSTFERTPMFLVPIPGESAWVEAYDAGRGRGGEGSGGGGGVGGGGGGGELGVLEKRVGRKRGGDNEGVGGREGSVPMAVDGSFGESGECADDDVDLDVGNVKRSNGNVTSDKSKHPACSLFPQEYWCSGDENNICCVAKMYEDSPHTRFRLNDVIEVVGVYTLDYATSSSAQEAGLFAVSDFAASDFLDMLPPASVAPRLHCIAFRRIGSSFPLLEQVSFGGGSSPGESELVWATVPRDGGGIYAATPLLTVHERGKTDFHQSQPPLVLPPARLAAARAELQSLLTAILSNATAAEYVLLALVSRVAARTDSEGIILGYLPLVVSGFSPRSSRVRALLDLIPRVVPRQVTVRADLATLNSCTVQPQKDYDRNRITPSPLQVGSGTVVVVDETGMQEGQLNENGVRSAHALRTLASKQVLPVSFTYCEVPVPMDSPLLFLTTGERGSLFAGQETVRVRAGICGVGVGSRAGRGQGKEEMDFSGEEPRPGVNCEDFSGEEQQALWFQLQRVCEEQWSDMRTWWAATRLQDVTMDAAVTKVVEDDFVNARQRDQALTSIDFHAWLTVARLLAVSLGERKITEDIWRRMRGLEEQRRSWQ